ncbi:MAG: DUF1127 domain-containing protein [Proteobacteria bacterium]|nr:DUF1127 domain-containing protein [Pseudomonadota bacterium]
MSDLVHNDTTLLAGRPVHRPVFAPAIAALWRWVSAPVRAFFARELVLRELAMLGDRDLHDIGLSRSDLPAVVRGMYRRDGLAARQLDPDA